MPKLQSNRSEIDNRAATVIPDPHVLLAAILRLHADWLRLEAGGEHLGNAENRKRSDECDRQRCGKERGESQNCDAGGCDEECTNALHGPNLSVQTNVGLLLDACKRFHTVIDLADVTKD